MGNTKIRMWIDTQWFTGTIIKHTPSSQLPHSYLIHFRSKGDKPLTYDLEKYNFKVLKHKIFDDDNDDNDDDANEENKIKIKRHNHRKHKKRKKHKRKKNEKQKKKRKRQQMNGNDEDDDDFLNNNCSAPKSKRRRLSLSEHSKTCNPFFLYLHDISKYRHELFQSQY